MPLQQRQQVLRRRLGGDDVAGADVDCRPHEDVELRAVIERQRMQHQVVAADVGIDQAAHVLPDDRLVGQHRALGRRLGAAGVDDLRQVAAHQLDRRRSGAAGSQFVEGQHVGQRRARLFRGQPEEVAHLRVLRRGGARQFGQAAVGGQQGRAGVAQHVGDFRRPQHEVDGHQHRAQPGQREAQRDEAVRIARQHRDPIPLADAAQRQPGGQPLAEGIKCGIGPAHLAAGDGGLGGKTAGSAMQEVGQGLATDDRIHVSLSAAGCRWVEPAAS